MTAARRRLGDRGEAAAAAWYEARGYQVVSRNWRCRQGEIDLIVSSGGAVVFCEVKTRSSNRFGTPAEAVTASKQRRIRGLAVQWLADNPGCGSVVRFDVAQVSGGQVDVIIDAF